MGEHCADGGGMYLRIKAAGKYWRMGCRFDGEVTTQALGRFWPMTHLTLVQASIILTAALATSKGGEAQACGHCSSRWRREPESVPQRGGASMFRFDIFQAKAWGAVGMGISSLKLAHSMRAADFAASMCSHDKKAFTGGRRAWLGG